MRPNSNDENMVIITDPDIVAQYVAEFDRRLADQLGRVPDDLDCRLALTND